MVKPRPGWLDKYTYAETIEILEDLALSHLAEITHPDKDALHAAIISGDWSYLLGYEVRYSDLPIDVYVHLRQALGFFKKLEVLKTGVDKEKAAFDSFLATEASCREVNDRFRDYLCGRVMPYPLSNVLSFAGEKFRSILGQPRSLSKMLFRYGPGATTNVNKKDANPRRKLGASLECSSELAGEKAIITALARELPHLFPIEGRTEVSVVAGKLQFVPKDALKYRSIIVEPILNGLFQQGLGREIRRCLLKVGIDLDDASRNARSARIGSISGELATVDFSNASNSISIELVAFLCGAHLPNRSTWFDLLYAARTGCITYKGEEYQLEMFSSMGNSFTFELESLIFYSLAYGICKHLSLSTHAISVFGDDLILPSSAKSLAELIFPLCGLELNQKKSFWSGPFRESCGEDYLLGFDIRPCFVKKQITPSVLFTIHNFYARMFDFERAKRVRRWIHPDLKLFGPDGFGDGHLIGEWLPYSRKKEQSAGWEGHHFVTFRDRSKYDRIDHLPGDSVLPCYSVYARWGVDEVSGPDLHLDPLQYPNPKRKAGIPMGHKVVPGSVGYEKVSIYTLRRGIFT